MPYFHVDRRIKSNGNNELHDNRCIYAATPLNRSALGYHTNAYAALVKARRIYSSSYVCSFCCKGITS